MFWSSTAWSNRRPTRLAARRKWWAAIAYLPRLPPEDVPAFLRMGRIVLLRPSGLAVATHFGFGWLNHDRRRASRCRNKDFRPFSRMLL
jgi:hypothetical protein